MKEIGLLRQEPAGSFDRDATPLRGIAGSPIERFLRHIDQSEHVVTDPLRAGVGAALLGEPVSLIRKSCFNTEAIFRSSIGGTFPKCRLIDEPDTLALIASQR